LARPRGLFADLAERADIYQTALMLREKSTACSRQLEYLQGYTLSILLTTVVAGLFFLFAVNKAILIGILATCCEATSINSSASSFAIVFSDIFS
jgi:hypothetical protein